MNQAIDFGKFLKQLVLFEGLKTKAYRDSVGIPTIGVGTIKYPNGTPVKMGDTCTEAQAYEYAESEAKQMFQELRGMLKVEQNENQLIALLCLAYNIGIPHLRTSSVIRAINEKQPMKEVYRYWMMWNKGTVNGQKVELKGLTVRRTAELKIYQGIINP